MSSSIFNKNANPITEFFMETLENYLYQAEEITDLIEDAADLIGSRVGELSEEEYQDELEDAHHFLIQSMDDYLADLNYFRYLGKFERLKIVHQQKLQIDLKNPCIKALDSDEEIDAEVRAVIKDVFDSLELIRAAMSEDTKNGIINISSAADEFSEATEIGRFVERDDMDDRMEYNFWLNMSRRLNFYELSEQMMDYLDEQETDGSEKIEVIKARLRGEEQKMFPAHLCTLDAFDDDDIEMAKHVIAEEDAQDAENELKGNDYDDNDDPEQDIADIFDYRDDEDTPEPSNNNTTNNGEGAVIIPMDLFRKKKAKDQPDPPKP